MSGFGRGSEADRCGGLSRRDANDPFQKSQLGRRSDISPFPKASQLIHRLGANSAAELRNEPRADNLAFG